METSSGNLLILRKMINIISSTPSENSSTKVIAKYIASYLRKKATTEVRCFPMQKINKITIDEYSSQKTYDVIRTIKEIAVEESSSFVFIVPEENGGIPNILKHFLALAGTSYLKNYFTNKKAILIGISADNYGNSVGVNQLEAILQHLEIEVLPKHLLIKNIEQSIESPQYINLDTKKEIHIKLKQLLNQKLCSKKSLLVPLPL